MIKNNDLIVHTDAAPKIPSPSELHSLRAYYQNSTCGKCYQKYLNGLTGWLGDTCHLLARCNHCGLNFHYKKRYPNELSSQLFFRQKEFESEAGLALLRYSQPRPELPDPEIIDSEAVKPEQPKLEEPKSAKDQEGSEDHASNDQDLRGKKRETGLLREQECRKDQRSGQGEKEEEEVEFHTEPPAPSEAQMKRIKLAFVVWVFFVVIFIWHLMAKADVPKPCIDALALARQCDTFVEALTDDQEVIGAFRNVDGFGDSLPCMTKLANLHKLAGARFEGYWSDVHHVDPSDANLRKLAHIHDGVEELARKIPVTITIACEHDLPAGPAAKGLQYLKGICPSCAVANVPMPPKGQQVRGATNESHGTGGPWSPPMAHSLDGTEAATVDVAWLQKERAAALYICTWGGRFNGNYAHEKLPRNQRDYTLQVEYIRSMVRMSRPRGSMPKISGAEPFPRDWLMKPMGDFYKGDQKSGHSLVIIQALRQGGVDYLDTKGKLLVHLPYFGPYEKGGWRYYAPNYCSELSRKARAQSGSELVVLSVPLRDNRGHTIRKNYGPIHTCFRQQGQP